ncbi:hypothetical protein BBG19_1690 [Francisella sp. MA067296]|nr:hypothetical protein [Francisella opportunistica]APC92414.1 hypothetical protein BBG19_1690 [Francisella sp. MA067296]
MLIQSVPLYCIVGSIFFGSFIVIIAVLELKNIIQGIVTKLSNKIIKK